MRWLRLRMPIQKSFRCLRQVQTSGVLPKRVEVDAAIAAAVDSLVAMRLEMLKAKNFAEADRIRDELSAKGIQFEGWQG